MEKNKGFTLIEIIVTISITFVFFGFVLPRYNDNTNQVKLKSDARKLVDVLELAKKKALSADLVDKNCSNFTGYRMSITGNSYSLNFCCESVCSSVQNYDLTNNITVIIGAGDYNFTALMNNPNFFSNTIRLKNSAIDKCVDVSISPIGVILLNETLISC